MDRQPVVCATCNGVPPAADAHAYTSQRARLIVANGYCSCRSAADAAHPVRGRAEQAPAQAAQPQRPGSAEGDATPESAPQSRPREERSPAEHATMVRA
ncbi:hypothetical protein AB0D67_17430 [Streptosporangium sp. NPDC048047]|uniref:hypothetical protein n=1 Tax=Streptosporangium sp. NPDC048047 TaxID=3155748 RepID=UPI0034226560